MQRIHTVRRIPAARRARGAALLLLCCMTLSLCACGKPGAGRQAVRRDAAYSQTVLTLALRSGTYADVIKLCLPEFERRNNVTCLVYELGEDELHRKVAAASAAAAVPAADYAAATTGTAYDLCMVDGSWMAEYTANGVLAELGKLGYELDDDIIPATRTICYADDGLYLAPFYGNVTVLLYNKLMLKEAGYTPETVDTLEDLMAICQFQKKRHNLGFMYRGDTENNLVVDFLPILRSYDGAWVVDEHNRPTVDTMQFAAAMNYYIALLKTGRAAKKDDLIAAIANKSAALGIGWPGWYTPTRNSSMDYLALSGRFQDGSVAYNANVYGIWTIGIPSASPHKQLAVKLLAYLMDRDVQKSTIEAGGVPCRYSSLRDPDVLRKFPQYAVVCSALEGGIYRPVMEDWSTFYTILGKEMRLIINGEKTVVQGLADAQRELEAQLQ